MQQGYERWGMELTYFLLTEGSDVNRLCSYFSYLGNLFDTELLFSDLTTDLLLSDLTIDVQDAFDIIPREGF